MTDEQVEEARRRYLDAIDRVLVRAKRAEPGVDLIGRLVERLGMSKSSVYAYLNGTTRPRTNALDAMLLELGARATELRVIATFLDEWEMAFRRRRTAGRSRAAYQLPAVGREFAGREAETEALDGLAGEEGIVLVEGGGGIGKSTLVVRWAERAAERFPDGVLYLDLRGHGGQRPVEAGEALHGFLTEFGVTPEAIPADLSARAALFRGKAAQRRLLVLLDNAHSADQVRPLLRPGGLTVVTGRGGLDGLVVREGARRVILGVLSADASLDLLEQLLGKDRVAAEPDAAAEIAALCAGVPLALSLVAARLDRAPGRSLAGLVAELRADRLAAIGGLDPDLDLRTIFQGSLERLPDRAVRLFALLGVYPVPSWSPPAAAALLGDADPVIAGRLLDVLAGAHMLTGGDRYAAHDLIREHQRSLAARLPGDDRRAALVRALDLLLATAVRAVSLLEPVRAEGLPAVSAASIPLVGRDEASRWLEAEYPAVRAMIGHAHADGLHRHAFRLAGAVNLFLRRTGRTSERVDVHRIALSAALADGDAAAAAGARRLLGDALSRAGRPSEAEEHLTEALAESRASDDHEAVFHSLLSLARLRHGTGQHAEGLDHAYAALAGASGLNLADALTNVASHLHRLGRPAQAIIALDEALAVFLSLGYTEGEAYALRIRGAARSALGGHAAALADLNRSLHLDRLLADRYWAAHTHAALADAHAAAGDRASADRHRRASHDLFDELGLPGRQNSAIPCHENGNFKKLTR